MITLNQTHNPELKSWLESANENDTEFPIQNLPFGVFRRKDGQEKFRCGVAIGDSIVDIRAAHKAGVFSMSLTPVVKTYPAERGKVAVDNGLQILGGYGFCSEFVLQQYYRDLRIYALYEGTTGIQSLDLLGRKIVAKGGMAGMLLGQEIKDTIQQALTFDDMKPYAKVLGDNLAKVTELLGFLSGFAQKGNYERFLADATIFMDFFGTVLIGWQWLKMGVKAKEALVSGNMQQSAEFYESKLHTMKFYYKYEMPRTAGLVQTILDPEVLTIAQEKELINH